MKQSSRIAAIAGMMFLMVIAACGWGGTRKIEIGGHTFNVPEGHLIRGTIPWLPASQSAALKFIVNPEARPEEQLIVTVEPTATICQPKTPPVSSQLASACLAATEKRNGSQTQLEFVIEKVHRNGDPTQWEYRLNNQSGKNKTVAAASCYALSDGSEAGLCTSLNNYKDLVYSVGLRDRDVNRLPAIWAAVHEMLSSWEDTRASE